MKGLEPPRRWHWFLRTVLDMLVINGYCFLALYKISEIIMVLCIIRINTYSIWTFKIFYIFIKNLKVLENCLKIVRKY